MARKTTAVMTALAKEAKEQRQYMEKSKASDIRSHAIGIAMSLLQHSTKSRPEDIIVAAKKIEDYLANGTVPQAHLTEIPQSRLKQ